MNNIPAETAGAFQVPIFPGNACGTGYITAIKEIFPYLDFMPTGGADTKEIMGSGAYEKPAELPRQTIEIIRACK